MAHLRAVSQALATAVQALPSAARAVRVLVIPVVVPPGGRCASRGPLRPLLLLCAMPCRTCCLSTPRRLNRASWVRAIMV
jgi:hypothetical protein